MTEKLIAVIDQGSTLTKGALCAADGSRRHEVSRPVKRRTEDGGIEHDPLALAAGVEEILDELVRHGRPAALGLACQRSTCLVWERASGRALTPAVSWQDTRQAARVEALASHAALVARRTGLRLSAHYAATKLAQLLANLPDGRERAAGGELVAGTLDAYLVRRLTGREATEPGHAGRTLLYDLERDTWDAELCELFGVPIEALPPLSTSVGDWGEARGVPLVAVAGDQQAALVGHGGWRTGRTVAHFGTGAFVLAATGDRPRRRDGLLTAVLAATPGARRFQLEGTVNSAGSAVDWAARLVGTRIQEWRDRPLAPERLPLVLPAFTGVAAPWWRPEARAAIRGLDLATGGDDLVAATLAGVAMRVLDNVEALAEALPELDELRVSGKLTRLDGLVGLVADAGGLPVEVAAEEEAGLAGVARLVFSTFDGGALDAPPTAGRRREPRWPATRAEAVRTRWRAFVERSLAG